MDFVFFSDSEFGKITHEFRGKHVVNDFGKILSFVLKTQDSILFVANESFFGQSLSQQASFPSENAHDVQKESGTPSAVSRGVFWGVSSCKNFIDHQNNKSTNLVSKNDTVDGSEILRQFR